MHMMFLVHIWIFNKKKRWRKEKVVFFFIKSWTFSKKKRCLPTYEYEPISWFFERHLTSNLYYFQLFRCCTNPLRGCAGGRIGTRFLSPRGTCPLNGVNPAGTLGYRNGTESFFGLNEGASVGCAGCINKQPTCPADET
jgi:hypothetical protein